MRQAIAVRRWALGCVALGAMLVPQMVQAQIPALVQFDTELALFEYSGGPFPIPLGSDPSNMLGDSIDGYGFVESAVTLTLSSQRVVNPGPASLGSTCALQQFAVVGKAAFAPDTAAKANCGAPPSSIDPSLLDGEYFDVDSFFDVFFDITVTDVDSRPGRNYAGQPDGASIVFQDNGPVTISASYEATFDELASNYALFPPAEADPYVGFIQVEIPLGGDINGNGENDKIKFIIGKIAVGDQNRQFIPLPDGSVVNQWDGAMYLDGAVVDESTDPPFRIGAVLPSGLPDPGAFGGPTTATSTLLNETPVPVGTSSWGTVKLLYRSEIK